MAIVKTVPAVPGTISGPVNICTYLNSDVVYSIAAVTGADSYTWTVPAGITIVSGQGTMSLTAHFGSTFVSGGITVKSVSNCGSSAAKSVVVSNTPPSTGAISGPASICAQIAATYSVVPVTEAISYTWTLPKGITPNTSVTGTVSTNSTTGITTVTGTTNSIGVDIDTSIVTTALATIKASAVNSCGKVSVAQSLSLIACRALSQSTNAAIPDEENSFNLYPNPSAEFFNLDISLSSDSEILLEVFDVTGKS